MTSQLERECTRKPAVTIEIAYGNNVRTSDKDEWQRSANPWTVTLRHQGRRLTVPYWTGTGIDGEPTAGDVLSSLISDTQAGEQSFEDFCGDFGYDTDSRRAHDTWEACNRMGRKVRQFLAADFDRFADCEH